MTALANDFEYLGAHPAPTTKTGMLALLEERRPVIAGPPRQLDPLLMEYLPLPPHKLGWHALTQGYGNFSECMANWCVGGVGISTAQCCELFFHRLARVCSLFAAYEFSPFAPLPPAIAPGGGGCAVLAPRSFYPLIEPTEKMLLSYLLGSAMTEAVGPQILHIRQGLTVSRLFHAKLLSTAAMCGAPVVLNLNIPKSAPDYIGYDQEFRGLHIFEGKGGAGLNYEKAAKAVDQLDNLVDVDGTAPSSRNACLSFHDTTPATGAIFVRTSVLHIPVAPVPNLGAPAGATANLLKGLYVLGMSCLFAALKALQRSVASGDGHVLFNIPELSIRVWLSNAGDEVLTRAFAQIQQARGAAALLALANRSGAALARLDQGPRPVDGAGDILGDDFTWVEGNWLGVAGAQE